tara:strand:- start:206113 stop:206904 length:792 start_codon:yes stop_codon:yes gene_type:complete
MFRRFTPSKNSAETLHFFSRLIGIGIVFSEYHFSLDQGFGFAVMDFFIQAISGFVLYILSLYTIDSIVLYNFEYQDEVVKRRNSSYSLIGLAHALGVAMVLKVILNTSGTSLVMLIFLWLFALVLIGFATKTFPLMSKLSFNRLLIQKNMAIGISYFGFFMGWSLIIASSLNIALTEIRWFSVQAILKILLSLIILPVFMWGIRMIFFLEDDLQKLAKTEGQQDNSNVEIGYGVYEGATFFTACFLTIVITGRIHFGDFYPTF